MTMSGGDDRTLDFYTREAPVYAEFAAAAEDSRFLTAFARSLPAGAVVLDFGCGPAWAAHRFGEMGFEAHGFDGSAGLAAQAKELYGIDVTVGPFEAFESKGLYDGIWASFCLLHDTREAMPGHLARLHRAFRGKGQLYVGLIAGEGHERDGHDRLYTYFTESEMRGLMAKARFADIETETEPSTGFSGVPCTSLHMFARRA